MVAPYATAEGLLAGVKVLDITAGLDAATEVATADLDAAVEATAAATAVAVAENVLTITLVADAAIHTFSIELKEPIEYTDIEMTDLVVYQEEGYELLIASDSFTGVEVTLGVATDGTLMEESEVYWNGMLTPILESSVFTKTYDEELATDVYTGTVVVDLFGSHLGYNLKMYSVPVEPVVVVVENAIVDDQVEEIGVMYMRGEWSDGDVIYPVEVEVPGFDATVAETVYEYCTVTVGGMEDTDPWLGFGQGDLNATIVDKLVTLKGVVSSWDGTVIDITISGTMVGSSVEDIRVNAETIKMIQNGQLIIIKNDKEYNVLGATVK